jgi:SAM-dependent methyltransferase
MNRRWEFPKLRRHLVPPNGIPLSRWITHEGSRLSGQIINVGSGLDERTYGTTVVRVDGFSPNPTVRANLDSYLPFRNESFDGAVCSEVLEHVANVRELLSEMARVLKPGAPALITVPFVFRYHPDPQDFRRFTPLGLRDELARAGLEVEFLSGIGGKATTLFLLAEDIHPLFKLLLRLVVFAVRPIYVAARPRHGVWSNWASHIVVIARRKC